MLQWNRKTPVKLLLELALLCLLLVTSLMMGEIYARYFTFDENQDSASVAQFEVTETLTVTKSDGQEVSSFVVGDSLIPGQSTTYTFEVTNNSEVTIKFIVSGDRLFEELPLTLTTSELLLQPGKTGTVEFVVSWDLKEENTNVIYGDKIEMIEITVHAEQVD